MEDCLFCQIVDGTAPSSKILETGGFVVIKNKFPAAPVHLLVLAKKHIEKKDAIASQISGFWDGLMDAAHKAIIKLGLDKTGYKLVNNGAGYNHFEHEHLHILGGSKEEPGGRT